MKKKINKIQRSRNKGRINSNIFQILIVYNFELIYSDDKYSVNWYLLYDFE